MSKVGVVLVGPGTGERATIDRFTGAGFAVRAIAAQDDLDAGLAAVRVAMDALAADSPKVAVVGYGSGGRYAFLAVTRLAADAAGAIAGVHIGAHLDESSRVKKPLSFHFADDDARVPVDEVRRIKGALEGFGTTEIYRYPTFDEKALADAERRVFAVLAGLG